MIDREGNFDNNVFEADGDKSSLRDDPVGGSGSVIRLQTRWMMDEKKSRSWILFIRTRKALFEMTWWEVPENRRQMVTSFLPAH